MYMARDRPHTQCTKGEGEPISFCIAQHFNLCLHLQTQDIKDHTYVIPFEKGPLHQRSENTKERDSLNGILIKDVRA